jgi:hypothetical protein
MTPENTTDEELHHLREDVDRVQDLVVPLLKNVRPDALGDDMGAMAFCFVDKQMEHIKSVCILVDNHQYRDAWAISRIMFEGLVSLYWASQDSTHTRAYNWRSYLWVGEFRQWYGKPQYLLHKEEIELNLRTHCTQFLLKKSKRKAQMQITPADYYKQWYIKSVEPGKDPVPISPKDMIKEIEFTPLYYSAYTLISGWFHWDSYLISQAVRSEGGCTDYTNETKWLGLLAYENGYRSLLVCAVILDDLFDLHSLDLQAEFKSERNCLNEDVKI